MFAVTVLCSLCSSVTEKDLIQVCHLMLVCYKLTRANKLEVLTGQMHLLTRFYGVYINTHTHTHTTSITLTPHMLYINTLTPSSSGSVKEIHAVLVTSDCLPLEEISTPETLCSRSL